MARNGRLERYRLKAERQLERYWLNAEECLELVETLDNQERKEIMLCIANAWLTLAEQHVRNSETYWCTRPPTTATE